MSIIAYGSSGTGKSHTMIGDEFEAGIIPKTVDFLIENSKEKIDECSIGCSMYEIYNEAFIDLLSNFGKQVKGSTQNFTEVNLNNFWTFCQVLKLGNSRRKTANTKRNHQSSRSHSVVKITLNGVIRATKKNTRSSIMLVDCAGSENSNDHFEEGSRCIRNLEMSKINKSSMNFAKVIKNLKKKDHFIDFRSSKLTTMLKPYLTGVAKAIIIATTSPEMQYLAVTKETLKVIGSANRIGQFNDSILGPGGGG